MTRKIYSHGKIKSLFQKPIENASADNLLEISQSFSKVETDTEGKKAKRVVKGNTFYKRPKPIKVGDIYKCVDCDEEFKTIMGAQIHKQTVHDKIRYDCHLCEKQFSQQSNLKTHIAA